MLGKFKKVIVFAFVPLLAVSLPISFAFILKFNKLLVLKGFQKPITGF